MNFHTYNILSLLSQKWNHVESIKNDLDCFLALCLDWQGNHPQGSHFQGCFFSPKSSKTLGPQGADGKLQAFQHSASYLQETATSSVVTKALLVDGRTKSVGHSWDESGFHNILVKRTVT